jgi:hypothetical protein
MMADGGLRLVQQLAQVRNVHLAFARQGYQDLQTRLVRHELQHLGHGLDGIVGGPAWSRPGADSRFPSDGGGSQR